MRKLGTASSALRVTLYGAIFSVMLFVFVWQAAEYYLDLPIHQVSADCDLGDVYFRGPKSEKFTTVVASILLRSGDAHSVEDNRVFASSGILSPEIVSIIRQSVRPDLFGYEPQIRLTLTERKIVDEYLRVSEDDRYGSPEECRLLEAAIAKDGIDIDARRSRPDIWPDDLN